MKKISQLLKTAIATDKMTVVYAPDNPPNSYSKSIFLAGPSPRNGGQYNWRPEALKLLEKHGYTGIVYVPLPENGEWKHDYDSQINWEIENLNRADLILFWVPRDMDSLPALTTNVEFGKYYDSGRVVLAYPKEATGMRYLSTLGKSEYIPEFNDLESAVIESIKTLGEGGEREGGERYVPLYIWNLPQFQSWYKSQRSAGNVLNSAEVLFNFRVGENKKNVFAFILHVDVYIADEGRNKTNEFIFSRSDVSTIVGYRKSPMSILDTEVVLIREFRSPARTEDGYVHEVPGGSSWKTGVNAFEIMRSELLEETGLRISSNSGISIRLGSRNVIGSERIRKLGSRQLCSTLSTHQSHAFACELTEPEMEFLKLEEHNKKSHGIKSDTENTFVEVKKLKNILEENLVDWSMVGQILAALM